MQSVQEMLRDIHGAIAGTQDEYKSIQEMIFDIWQCIEVDEETGESYIKVKAVDE